ncbi:MAG: hypothetical protein AB1389_02545 [Campylobacterota bacterium]
MAQENQTVNNPNPQTADVLMSDKDILSYQAKKVTVKKEPAKGQNVAVYVRPGDQVEFNVDGLDLESLEYRLVGGDIVVQLPSGGLMTFVSMALMGYSDNPPGFMGVGGQTFSLGQVLSQIEEVNDLPFTSLPVEADIQREDNVKKIVEELEETLKQVSQMVVQQEYIDEATKTADADDALKFAEPPVEIPEVVENEYTSDAPTNPMTSAENSKVEGVVPTLTFDIDIQHIEVTDEITGSGLATTLFVTGGGGGVYANDYPSNPALSELQKQTNAEDVDYRSANSSVANQSVITADNPTFFGETYTSRLIKLSPSQPAGFGLTVIKVSGVPSGVSIVGGTSQGGGVWLINEADDLTGGFTVNENNGEINFAIKYETSVSTNFAMTIEAESVWSLDNLDAAQQVDAEEPVITSITFEKTYGVNIKEVDLDTPLSYKYTEVGGYADGFVLATNLNDNIIRTGDIDTTVIGGVTTDSIIAQSGDDSLYGGKGNDTIAPGLGDDLVDGGEGNDTVSYNQLVSSNAGAGVIVDLIAGTATGSGNDTLVNIENIEGSTFRDTLSGSNIANIILGGAGNDTIDGKSGDDSLYGEAGNDTVRSGDGSNYIDGGTGTDTVDYSALTDTNGVTVRLLSPDAVTLGESWGDASSAGGTDRLVSIENVIGSDYNDTFSGADNTNNTFDGRSGSDIVDYSSYTSNAINANLDEGWVIGQGTDKLINIEAIKGTDLLAFGDTIIGSASVDNTIYGMAGNDTLKGVGGANSLYGGSGNDLIHSGTGNDLIDGGTGTNTLSYEDVIAIGDATTTGVTVKLYDTNAQDTGKGGIDTISNIQNLIGTSKNDTLSGNLGVNTINGLGGTDTVDYSYSLNAINANLLTGVVDKGNSTADTILNIENIIGTSGNDTIIGSNVANVLDGGDGNDYFMGNAGNNTILGGDGSDLVDYSGASFGVKVTLDNSGNGTALIGSQTDTLEGIENIKGTNYSDTIISNDTNSMSNTFWGGVGNDTLGAGSGDDYLYGESGDDKIIASNGSDFIDGGSDSEIFGDTLDFSSINAQIALTLAEDGNESRAYEDGIATHRVYNVENIIASDLDSTLKGNSKNNTLTGGAGADTLSGGAGTNYLDGGSGVNTVDYSDASNEVTVDLSKSGIQEVYTVGATTVKDVLVNIQNVIGSNHKDIITGNSASNSLYGGLGNDTIVGSSGNDTLDGGDGIDVASYTNATDDLYIDLGVSGTPVSISATYGSDTFISIEGAIGGSGDDTIIGTSSSNVLIGGDGDDTLLPNGNNGNDELDIIDGGSGTDFVSFAFGGATNVTLDLADSGIQNTGKGKVQITNIENVEGGAGNDKLYGNSSNNTLSGLGGDDTLVGRAGNNKLDGGADFDTADYSSVSSLNGINVNLGLATEQVQNNGYVGKDTLVDIEKIIATNNADIIQGNTARVDANTLYFELGAGNDTIYAGSGANVIYTSRIDENGTDYTSYNNTVFSGSGSDTVYGSSGSDTFVVSSNDALGTTGNDTFYGISGTNTIDYSQVTDSDINGTTGGIDVTLDGTNAVNIVLKDGGNTNTIQNVSHIIGTGNNDTLTGDSFNNILDGGTGDDTIFGTAGNNTLSGGSGADSITGGTGVDTIYGGLGDDIVFSSIGNDTVYGGDGIDTFDLSGRTGIAFVNLGENRSRIDTNSNGDFDTDDENDVLFSIEKAIGNSSDNTIYGDSNTNILDGGTAGNNSLYGAGGDDTLIGSGSGIDIAYYKPTSASIYVDMTQTNQIVRDGDGGSDKLIDINEIYGSDYGDTFSGNGDNNTFRGSVGDDTFYSSTGSNVHDGGADNDLFLITSKDHGVDTLIGGLGSDTVDFSGVVDLGTPTRGLVIELDGNETVQATLNDVNSHKLTGIENITGTIYDDTIIGDHNNNILRGHAGDNTLIGGAGDDTLVGGTGTDVASYETSTSGIDVDLTQINFQVTDDGLGGRDKLDGIDTIIGSDYADTFKGSTTDDTFMGGIGDDWFIGSQGSDYYQGGSTSSDTVDYSGATTDLNIDINDGAKYINSFYGTHTFIDINGIVGGSGDDTLTGNSGRNTLVGGSGDDTLLGFGGDDYIDGGSGSDFVSFAYTSKDIELDLAITDAQDTNDGMLTIKNIQNIAGGAGSDTIYGNTDNNILSGGYGSDTLSGRGGNNTLIGGLNGFELTLGAIVVGTVYSFAIEGQTISYTAQSGDTKADVLDALEDTFKANGSITTSYIVNDGDKLYVETNDGVGTLALNNITSVTESFIDIADYSINPYNGIKVDLSLANGQVYDNGNGGSDTLVGIEQLKGSNYADTFIGSNGNDTIYGGAGNDTFTGGTGNDTFYGETGDDLFISSYNDGNNTYYGGTTDEVNGDTIDYSGITDSEYKVIGDLSNSTISVYNSDATPVLQKTDTINSIENLTGGAGNDTLRGNTSKNTLKGGTGSDTIYASEGGDRLFGEEGDDRFVFENGVDGSSVVIDGGTTSQTNGDTIDYSALTDGVALRLMGTSYSGVTVGVTTNHHTIRNINNILGSQGDDTIEGDSGNNILDGHDGLDTVSFENSGAKVVVNIGAEVTLNSITYTTNQASGTTIGTDTITNFENIVAGSGDDTLIGSSVLNTIYGGIGKDFIYGGEGDDKLYGEDGNDTITGGIGNDTIDGGEGSDTVSYFDADKAIVNLRGATYGSGTVTYGVDDYTDRLYSIENVLGSAGNDTIQGNETNNTLDGAGGTNTVSYSGAASGVVVDLGLQGQTQDTVGDGVDYLANFADLIGSSQADTLKGDTNTNMINGGAGDDTITV